MLPNGAKYTRASPTGRVLPNAPWGRRMPCPCWNGTISVRIPSWRSPSSERRLLDALARRIRIVHARVVGVVAAQPARRVPRAGEKPGRTGEEFAPISMIVPAPITSVVWTRLTKTSISLVHVGRSAQSSGRSDSQGSSVKRVSWMSSRICHALPLNVSRLRAFQYSGSLGHDAHDLVAVARPVDRPVALRPREPHRVLRAEALGEGAVVEPGLTAVGGRRHRQRAHERHDQQPEHAEPGLERQPLQPQEAHGQRRDRQPEQHGPRAADRHDRRGDHDDQHRERHERIAALGHLQRHPLVRPHRHARPERQQPREDEQLHAEQLEHDPRPRIGARVRQPDGAERLEPAAEPGQQLVPVPRPQVPELEPREQIAREERGADHDHQRERAQTHAQPPPRRGGAVTASTASAEPTAASTHSSTRVVDRPSTSRCHCSAPTVLSAASPNRRAPHCGSNARLAGRERSRLPATTAVITG